MVHAQAGLSQGVGGLHRFSSRLSTDAERPRAESGPRRRSRLMRFQDDDSLTTGLRVLYLKFERTLRSTQKACGAPDGLCCSTTCGAERGKNQVQCA